MFAKMVLPLLGGSPAVWTTCMLFFQTELLLGYLYAHWATRVLRMRRQAILHGALLLLSTVLLPLMEGPSPHSRTEAAPVVWLIGLLLTSVGLPFFMLSTTAPLLQRWFSTTNHKTAADPYFLYAASNAGSLAALLAYPTVVEPLISLVQQRVFWGIGYLTGSALIAGCAIRTLRTARRETRNPTIRAGTPLTIGRRVWWVFVAFVPSGLMLAVTSHLSTDVATVPLLWIVPLALYLLSFIVAFSQRAAGFVLPTKRVWPLVLLPLLLLLTSQAGAELWFVVPLHLANFFIVAVLCHCQLAEGRPDVSRPTEFYVWLAVGGMLGGLFNTAIAPEVFVSVAEYPILVAASAFAVAPPAALKAFLRRPREWMRPSIVGISAMTVLLAAWRLDLPPNITLVVLGIPAVLAFGASRRPVAFAFCVAVLLASGIVSVRRQWQDVQLAERTFFGVYRVVAGTGGFNTLFHGTTVHGRQKAEAASDPEPLTYYHAESPVADVLADLPAGSSVGAIGLGVGSVAAYAKPGQQWTFYEIDPAVDRIARDERFFTFLRACGATCRVTLGDGRLLIESTAEIHDVLVLDAFSSDAIPVHHLTREAVETYLARLSEPGILLFHISNRHFDLQPLLGRLAVDRHLYAMARFDRLSSRDAAGREPSHWVAMSRSPEALATLSADRGWNAIPMSEGEIWTDNFSNIWSVLRWRAE